MAELFVDRPLIVAAARRWIGTPYMHMQSVQGVGCDCLGLVRGVYRELYGSEPEAPPVYASSWRDGGGDELLLEAARRHLVERRGRGLKLGAVLVFRWRHDLPARHCGILTGIDRMVHAYEAAGRVSEGTIGLWGSRLAAVFDFREVS